MELVVLFQDHRPLDRVLQFANVAGPVIFQHQFAGFFGDAGDVLAKLAVVALDEKFDQRKDVFFALAQRRKKNRDDRQPVVQGPGGMCSRAPPAPGRD